MKRIEFIAPVEAMRGNLSGAQKLVYAKKDNPAWDAPEGKSYARNYKPRFIGAKRAATGATIFATKVRSAINNSTKVKVAQAVLGSMPMLLDGVETNLSLNGNLYACYNASKQKAQGYSLRKYFIEKVQSQVSRGAATISIVERSGSQTFTCAFANPYIKPGISSADTIIFNPEIIDKFFDQLSNGRRFKIEGAGEGITFGGWTYNDLLTKESGLYNVLGLSKETIGGNDYMKLGNLYLQETDTAEPVEEYQYLSPSDLINDEQSTFRLILTEVAPSA